MTRIGVDGSIFGKAKTKRVEIGRPRNGAFDDLFFSVSAEPALYRVDIVFRNRTGKRLGAYGQYFRVVSPLQDARLRLNATSYRPGETVYARVENFGTELVTYGVSYSIERYNGTSWGEAPESPNGPWILPLLFSQPGTSGRCSGFSIPTEMTPGRYRFAKPADYAGHSGSGPRREVRVLLTAEFDVAF